MGFSDLEFGWDHNRLSLSDVKINSRFVLEEQNKDGEWIEFEPPSYLLRNTDGEREAENKKYEEALKTTRYSKPKRWLSAKWLVGNDIHSTPYLGIPENKEEPSNKLERRLESIEIVMHEVSNESDEYDVIGSIYCRGEMPYISVSAPSSVFDDIERMADQSGVIFDIELHMMGWNWTGPIGDSEFYIDTENRHPLIFTGLIVTKKHNGSEKERLTEELEQLDYPQYYSQDAMETNMHLFKKLMDIGKVVDSTKVATWITAAGVLAIAVKMWA